MEIITNRKEKEKQDIMNIFYIYNNYIKKIDEKTIDVQSDSAMSFIEGVSFGVSGRLL